MVYSKSKQLLGSSHWKHGLNNLDSEKYIQQMAYRACSRYFLPTARVSGIFNTRTTPLCRREKCVLRRHIVVLSFLEDHRERYKANTKREDSFGIRTLEPEACAARVTPLPLYLSDGRNGTLM